VRTAGIHLAGRGPLVLCYHSISDGWPDPLAVPPRAFEDQLRTVLRRRFRSVPASDVLHRTGRLVHVTFDDAYRNVLETLPVLERLDVDATVFACTAYAGEGRPLLIRELVGRARGYEQELATMNWNELRAAAERGVEIGSHTVDHAHLPKLSDSELRRQLVESKDHLEDELGRPCRYLAYPFGESDDRVHAAARDAGYEAAFALRAKPRSALDRYAVPRVDIYRRDGRLRFWLKTSGFHGRLTSLAARFRVRGQAEA
jgi:peptidoglycan/xylan/chitin deacetylase (PgdA/CDA1 family)